MPLTAYMVPAFIAFLLGSIPSGFLLAKAKGVDIRTLGSGNIGATNVFRFLGLWAGVAVMLIDVLKGVAAVLLANWSATSVWPARNPQELEWINLIAAFCAVLGHNYTPWLRFKGGKGIATSAGVLAALVPIPFLVILTVWAVLLALTRLMSLASIAASATLPFAVWVTSDSKTLLLVTALMAGLAIYKHRSNIRRLLNGTESRLTFGKSAREPSSTPPPSSPPRQS